MTTMTEHPKAVRDQLKRAGLSEQSELSEDQAKRARSKRAKDLKGRDRLAAFILKGENGNGPRASATKYPEAVRAIFRRALEITGTPEQGGPKYPLTVKQADAVRKSKKGREALESVTDAQLKKIAQGKDASKDATKAVRDFLKANHALKDDRTMYARKGAAILLAEREAK